MNEQTIRSLINELDEKDKELLVTNTDAFIEKNGRRLQAEVSFLTSETIDFDELQTYVYPQFYDAKGRHILDRHAILFDRQAEYYASFVPTYKASFQYAGQTYDSIDSYMTYQKQNIQATEDIWDDVKQRILYRGLRASFSQNPMERAVLLNTGSLILAYMEYDQNWGTNETIESENAFSYLTWTGDNLYGKTLVFVRDELRHWQEASLYVANEEQPLPYIDAIALPANQLWQTSIEELYKKEELKPVLDAYFKTLRPGFGLPFFAQWDRLKRYSLFTIEGANGFPKQGLYELKQDLYDMVLFGTITL